MKQDRHQNVVGCVAVEKGVDGPWTLESVVRFIDLLGYREITLESDTGIIAFRNRVAAMCKSEVATEDALRGDKQSNRLIESTVILQRGIISTIECRIE